MRCRQNEEEIARLALNKFFWQFYDEVKGEESLPIVACSFLKEKMQGEIYFEVIFREKEICKITCPYIQLKGPYSIKPVFHQPEICEVRNCEIYIPDENKDAILVGQKIEELNRAEVHTRFEEVPDSIQGVKEIIEQIKEEALKSDDTALSNDIESTQKEIMQIVTDNEDSIDPNVIRHLQDNGANFELSEEKIESLAVSDNIFDSSLNSFNFLISESTEIVTGVEMSKEKPLKKLEATPKKPSIVFPGPETTSWVNCDESLRLHGTESTLQALGLHISETASTNPVECRAKFDGGVKVKLSFGAKEAELCHSHLLYPANSETPEVEAKSGDCIEGRGFHPAVIDSEPRECDDFNFNRAFAFFRSEEGGKVRKAFVENVVKCEEISGRGVFVRMELKFNGKECEFEVIFNKRGESKLIGQHNCLI